MGVIVKNGIFYGAGVDTGTGTSTGSVSWNSVTNKPTTARGYGITDVYTKTQINNLIEDKIIDYIKQLYDSGSILLPDSQGVGY